MSTSEERVVEYTVVHEAGISLKVNKESLSPKRNEAYYCKEMEANRALIATALSVFNKSQNSVFIPVQCLDGIGASGVAGLMWKKHLLDDVEVSINDTHEKSCEIISENAKNNNLSVKVMRKDLCVLLHEMPFSFIYIDCHTDAALYMDAIFRNVPKRGIVAITTKDDGALFGRTPEMALRNYGGTVAKTFYSKELAVRLILAGMVSAAARHSKGLKVLCVTTFKSSLTIIVEVLKGPAQANTCVEKLRRLVHCNICEERAFYPSSLYPIETPSKLLACDCVRLTPGKVMLELGPMWSGSLFDHSFIFEMSKHLEQYPWKPRLKELLDSILTEAWCPKLNEEKVLASLLSSKDTNVKKQEKEQIEVSCEAPMKKWKGESTNEISPEAAPVFYFNLHRHSPKGPQMVPVGKVVIGLRKAGFRASRTHFDPVAVRTNATLVDLKKVLSKNTGEVLCK